MLLSIYAFSYLMKKDERFNSAYYSIKGYYLQQEEHLSIVGKMGLNVEQGDNEMDTGSFRKIVILLNKWIVKQ